MFCHLQLNSVQLLKEALVMLVKCRLQCALKTYINETCITQKDNDVSILLSTHTPPSVLSSFRLYEIQAPGSQFFLARHNAGHLEEITGKGFASLANHIRINVFDKI